MSQLIKCLSLTDDNESGRKNVKPIVDFLYNYDHLERISELFKYSEEKKRIKIDPALSRYPLKIDEGRFLKGVFILPDSKSSTEKSNKKDSSKKDLSKKDSSKKDSSKKDSSKRVFDFEYKIRVEGELIKCQLTNQWEFSDPENGKKSGDNHFSALKEVIKYYYRDILYVEDKKMNNTPKSKKPMQDDNTPKSKNPMQDFYIPKLKYKDMPDFFQNKFGKSYITSLLAKPFVILMGNSGTGKTRLSKQLAEFFEIEDSEGNKNWLLVPVGADWTDNTKVLGFYNPIANDGKGKYEKTGILKLIERANQNPDTPFFLILDEMNLSHVERYFSDFLSHMETPDIPFELDGYQNPKSENQNENPESRNSLLKFPDNLFITGTVNVDETTYMFSPKVLDRANVIDIEPSKEEIFKLFSDKTPGPVNKITPNTNFALRFLMEAREIRNGKVTFEDDLSKVEEILSEIYEVLKEVGYEFSYRTLKEILYYFTASQEFIDLVDKKTDPIDILDEQLLQKILPKIHGNQKEIGILLKKLKEICDDNGLKESGKKINKMKGKLDNFHYASFI